MYSEKSLKTLSTYVDNGIVVATVDDFMQNFKSLVGYHNSVTEENSLPPSDAHKRQSGNIKHTYTFFSGSDVWGGGP